MKVIGYRKSDFDTKDGNHITGYNLYLSEPLQKGEGVSGERVYITDKVLEESGYKPHVGDEVRLDYNRFGKVSGVTLVSPGK